MKKKFKIKLKETSTEEKTDEKVVTIPSLSKPEPDKGPEALDEKAEELPPYYSENMLFLDTNQTIDGPFFPKGAPEWLPDIIKNNISPLIFKFEDGKWKEGLSKKGWLLPIDEKFYYNRNWVEPFMRSNCLELYKHRNLWEDERSSKLFRQIEKELKKKLSNLNESDEKQFNQILEVYVEPPEMFAKKLEDMRTSDFFPNGLKDVRTSVLFKKTEKELNSLSDEKKYQIERAFWLNLFKILNKFYSEFPEDFEKEKEFRGKILIALNDLEESIPDYVKYQITGTRKIVIDKSRPDNSEQLLKEIAYYKAFLQERAGIYEGWKGQTHKEYAQTNTIALKLIKLFDVYFPEEGKPSWIQRLLNILANQDGNIISQTTIKKLRKTFLKHRSNISQQKK